jgi:hypothetical protein
MTNPIPDEQVRVVTDKYKTIIGGVIGRPFSHSNRTQRTRIAIVIAARVLKRLLAAPVDKE